MSSSMPLALKYTGTASGRCGNIGPVGDERGGNSTWEWMKRRKKSSQWSSRRVAPTIVGCYPHCWQRSPVTFTRYQEMARMIPEPATNPSANAARSPPYLRAAMQSLGNRSPERTHYRMRNANLRQMQEQGRYEWRVSSGCTRQSLAENAMSRIKALFGDRLSARRLDNQRAEATVRCTALNRMTSLGMPDSVRI